MSKKKARPAQKQPTQPPRRRQRLLLILSIILGLVGSSVILARWGKLPATSFFTSATLLPTPTTTPTPNPFLPKRVVREYVYVGGELQSIEETARPAGGTAFDFTGSSAGELVIWRPSESNWYVLDISTDPATVTLQQLGQSTDHIVPGDYDGDDKTDIAVWRPKNGTQCNGCGWYIKQSSTPDTVTYQADWGAEGDVTVPADYNGDGWTEKAVWRPSEGTWYFLDGKTNTGSQQGWGQSGDRPVPADYDGDGKADLAVFRPSDGTWYIKLSTGGSRTQGWGESGDVLAPADYDGDGKADLTFWRPSDGQWRILQSSNGATRIVAWGQNGDRLVPADYDGDGRTDIAIWRPSDGNWYIRKSSDGTTLMRNWGGSPGDQPVPAAYVREP